MNEPTYHDSSFEPENRQDFWEFLDVFVESRDEIVAFCKKEKLQLLEKIGGGGFGSVYLVKDMFTGEKFVLKILDFGAKRSDIFPRWFESEDTIHCNVYVEVSLPLQEILINERVSISPERLIPFCIDSSLASEEGEEMEIETIKYPELIERLCREEKQQEMHDRPDTFLPGLAESFIGEMVDPEKLKQLTIAELMALAPSLLKEHLYVMEEGEVQLKRACREILPFRLEISLREILEQGKSLFLDSGKSLVREFFYDPLCPQEPYWKFAWLVDDLLSLKGNVLEQKLSIDEMFQRYSSKELEIRFPALSQLKIPRKLPAASAIQYLEGEKKQEVKRLLAVKNEAIMASSVRQYYPGINQVSRLPRKIGNNILILSPFLYACEDIYESHLYVKVQEIHEGEKETRYCLAFPVVVYFLYQAGKFIGTSSWNIGDIKQGNFRLTLEGQWKLVDYGGHLPETMDEEGPESLVGSNDYASYSLFHVLNAPPNSHVSSSLVRQARDLNSKWFSLVKAAVRMCTGRGADRARGNDLNNALMKDFQGYHENMFANLVDILLFRKDSPYHHRQFSLVNKDVENFFSESDTPSLETALRRFLFVVGLTLTGCVPWSLLDENMQKKVTVRYRKESAQESTWMVSKEGEQVVITEFFNDANLVSRKGLDPLQALKLMMELFPGLEKLNMVQTRLEKERKQVLTKAAQLGIVDMDRYFDPPKIKHFSDNLRNCLAPLMEVAWMDPSWVEKIWAGHLASLTDNIPDQDFPEVESLDEEEKTSVSHPDPSAFSWEDKLQELRLVLSNVVQYRKPKLSTISQLLGEMILWQRRCFNQYLGVSQMEYFLDLEKIELFFLDRWARVQYAFRHQRNDLLEHVLKCGWVDALEPSSLERIRGLSFSCRSEEHATVLLNQELERARKYGGVPASCSRESWNESRQKYVLDVEKHALFPLHLKGSSWNGVSLSHFLWEEALGNEGLRFLPQGKKERMARLRTLCIHSERFEWADLAICEEILEGFSSGVAGWLEHVVSSLEKCGFGGEIFLRTLGNEDERLNGWIEWVAQWGDQEDFLQDELLLEVSASCKHCTNATRKEKLEKGAEIADRVSVHLQRLRQEISCHFLFLAMSEQESPLKYLDRKLRTFASSIPHDKGVEALLEKVEEWERFIEKQPYGQIYSEHVCVRELLPQIDHFYSKWEGYAVSKRMPGNTRQYMQYQAICFPIDERPVLDYFNLDQLFAWSGDRIKNRIARFLARVESEEVTMGAEENQAIERLIRWFYEEHGLKMSEGRIGQDKTVAKIYQVLQRESDDFQKLPACLEDLKKIAMADTEKITAQTLRDRFHAIIPVEVQPPNFQRSVLLEFLEYQIRIFSEPLDRSKEIHKRILLKQLAREAEELQQKFIALQKAYPEHLLSVENLALLKPGPEIRALVDESREKWPLSVRIFEEYLRTSRMVIAQQTNEAPWDWKPLLENLDYSILQRIYPELKYPELRDIHFLIFDLSPLPSIKETREFMQKCQYWNLTQQDREKIKQALSEPGKEASMLFSNAMGYLDRHCWSLSEESVREMIFRLEIETNKREEIWTEYLEARKKLPLGGRIQKEARLLKQLEGPLEAAELERIFMMELWFIRFQYKVDRTIVNYFVQEFDLLSEEEQRRISQTLQRTRVTSDSYELFNWVFNQFVFLPSLVLLDSASWFGSKPSETVISALSQKYMTHIPVEVQFNIARFIKEKLTIGWQRQQIFTEVNNMIV